MEKFPDIEMVDAHSSVELARQIKTEREVKLLKSIAEVVNVAHKELRKHTLTAIKVNSSCGHSSTRQCTSIMAVNFS